MKDKKTTLYAYVKPRNKAYLSKLSLKTGQSNSYCLDAIIDAIRLKRDVKIPEKTNEALKQLNKIKDKKKKEIQKLENR